MYGDWTIRGTRRDGTSTVGHWEADSSAEATIKSRYDSGWRTAILVCDGVEVGRIADNADGERVWWAAEEPDAD